jgi:hypothetical protein
MNNNRLVLIARNTFSKQNNETLLRSISAIGAHLGARPRWKVAANVIIMANGKR